MLAAVAVPPGNWTNLQATMSGRSVVLKWDALTSGDQDKGNNVYRRSPDSGGVWAAHNSRSTQTTYTFRSLTRGQTYRFRVKAYNHATSLEEICFSNRVEVAIPQLASTPTPMPDPTGAGASFSNVRVVETTADCVRPDWDTPPTGIAGVRATCYRHGDPTDHIYHALDQFGTRVASFCDRNVDPGQTHTCRGIPRIVSDVHAHVFSRADSTPGQSVPLAATTPPGPPFVARAPTGLNVPVRRQSSAVPTWNHTGHETPAYIFQWRKANEANGDSSESHPRTLINSGHDTARESPQAEGFTATLMGTA